jgi:molecular chaperone GrpE
MNEKPTKELTDFEFPESVSDSKVEKGPEEETLGSESPADLLESYQKEKADLHDRWLRKEAEIQNLRKRFAREKQELTESARASVLKEILPVIDSCERGLESFPERASSQPVKVYQEGFELLLKGLNRVLTRFEVEEVPGVGQKFDPMVHEALLVEEREGHEDGEILELLRKGYRIRSRLLRPAQVTVSSVPSGAPLKEY